MFRRLLSKLRTPSSSKQTGESSGEGAPRPRHLSCPRCRRLLIVPNVDTFRCKCSMIFRVTGTADSVRLCFSLVNQDANAQGCGLPRSLVERMPVTVVTEEMCTTTVAAAETETESESAPCECSEESKQDAPAPAAAADVDDDSMTCRICLSGYKTGDEVRVLPCFHRFHVDEIDDWLDRNMACPLCHLDINLALTGSSGTAFVRAVEGNPTGVIERTKKRK